MKYRKIFVFMLMIVVMTTVYGQERYRAKPASTQLSIYSLPPLERAISCIKFYDPSPHTGGVFPNASLRIYE